MRQAIKLEMDPKEWSALCSMASRSEPKSDEEKALHARLKEDGPLIAKASMVEIREPF